MQSLKRSFVDEVDGGRLKYPRLNFFRLESDSDGTDERSESVASLQLRDTASPHDTSDTSDKSDGEYSLESITDVEVPDVSSSSDDNICVIGQFSDIVSEFGSDISVVADLSDSKSSSGDSEIGRANYWQCLNCKTTNKNPCVRYCAKCFRAQKSFLPPRPKNKRKKTRMARSGSSQGLSKQDSGLGLSQPSSEDSPPEKYGDSAEQLCGACCERPANGVFVHQKSGHQLFCYQCSQRIWMQRKRCPYCNRVILRVVQLHRVGVMGEQ